MPVAVLDGALKLAWCVVYYVFVGRFRNSGFGNSNNGKDPASYSLSLVSPSRLSYSDQVDEVDDGCVCCNWMVVVG